MNRILGVALALAILGGATRADGCSAVSPPPHEVLDSEKAVDSTAPDKIEEITVSVGRGGSTEGGGCSGSSGPGDSCAGIGRIALYPKVPADDRTAPEKIGYVIKLQSGASPVFIPPGAVRTYADGAIHLIWDDGETNDQETFDITVVVHAVDLAGNVSEPSEPVRISSSGGKDDGGCATRSPQGSTSSFWLAMVALVTLGCFARLRLRLGVRVWQRLDTSETRVRVAQQSARQGRILLTASARDSGA